MAHIQFGDLTPDILQAILGTETPAKTLPLEPPGLSPQLQFSLTPKQPRKPPQLSRIVSPMPPPPETLASTAKRSYVSVPSQWCIDSRLSRATYLSRNPFLRKMLPRRLFYRKFLGIQNVRIDQQDLLKAGVEIKGIPLSSWLTFPLKPPNKPECAEPPPLEDEPLSPDQETSHAWVIGPWLYTRDTLNRQVNRGPEPFDGLAFPWVTNASSTKMLSLEKLTGLGINKINGFVECPRCRSTAGLSYLLPRRFASVVVYLMDKSADILARGEQILRNSSFSCNCDGKANQTRPVISEDWNKINWLFMVLGCHIGHCNRDQLTYFCRQLKVDMSGSINDLLLRVYVNICEQLYPGCYSDTLTFLQVGKFLDDA